MNFNGLTPAVGRLWRSISCSMSWRHGSRKITSVSPYQKRSAMPSSATASGGDWRKPFGRYLLLPVVMILSSSPAPGQKLWTTLPCAPQWKRNWVDWSDEKTIFRRNPLLSKANLTTKDAELPVHSDLLDLHLSSRWKIRCLEGTISRFEADPKMSSVSSRRVRPPGLRRNLAKESHCQLAQRNLWFRR